MSNTSEPSDYENTNGFFSVKFDTPVIIIAVLTILLNALVLVLVTRFKHLRTKPNYLLSSLAVSDLLTGLVDIPMYLACNIIRKTTVCILADSFLRLTSVSTTLHLVAVSVDRFIAIKHPLRYNLILSTCRSHVIKILIWLVSILVAFVQLTWNNPASADLDGEGNTDYDIPFDVANLVVFFAIPLMVMLSLYGILLHNYFNFNRKHPKTKENPAKDERKTILVFVMMFVVYCACWLPYFLARLQHNIGNSFFELPHILEYIFIYLRFINAFLNPCFYVFGKSDFRKALKEIITGEKVKNIEGTIAGSVLTDAELTSVHNNTEV